MNVFNVHSNRSPVDGVVTQVVYNEGLFVNAAFDKASARQRAQRDGAAGRRRHEITCVQVAGLIARRILCYVKVGDSLARGQRYGFIRFGSRVDVYLPPGSKPRVAIGDKVKATSTVLAELPRLSMSDTPGSAAATLALGSVRKRGIYLLPNLFTTLQPVRGLLRDRAGR